MTTANVYFAISQPTGALPDLGPGTPSPPLNPIGSGVTVGSSSDSSAQMELRVTVLSSAGNAGSGNFTVAEIIKGLDRLKLFVRQRGFIEGSGGPATGANYNTP